MPYSLSTLDDGRILLLTLDEHYDLADEMIRSSQDVIAYLDQAEFPVILITDARAVQIKELNTLLTAAQYVKHPEVKASLDHPALLKYYSVIDNMLINAAVRGLNTATFGYFAATLVETVDAALDQARALLAADSSSN